MSLAEKLRAALQHPVEADILTGDLSDWRSEGTPAAVLIAITDRIEPGVILTVRRENLRTHAGQIAFPGGKIDPGEDAAAAALREASEEIGLAPASVDIVAALDRYRTITDYAVTPIVAVIPPDLPLAPHQHEVADLFEAPLGHLIDPANHVLHSVTFDGQQRQYYEIMWGKRRIWGATAAMLVNLSRRPSFA